MEYETEMTLEDLQREIDREKWLASERAGRDLCGTADYCAFCNKKECNPCARAFRAWEKNEMLKAAAVTEESEARREIRYRRSFKSKLIQNEKIQDFYSRLKNNILGYAGLKCRLSFHYETFRTGKNIFAKFGISGKTLCLYLALSPSALENGKYRFTDVSDKKSYAQVPVKLRITSNRALNYAKQLIKLLAEKSELANVGNILMDYRYAYASDEKLIAKGLVKPYLVTVRNKK